MAERQYRVSIRIDGTDNASPAAEKAKGAYDGLKAAIFGALSVAAVVGAGKTVMELAQIGAESERLRDSFMAMVGGPEAMTEAMDEMRASSLGAISDTNLILAANKARLLGVAEDAQTLGKLMEVATVRGRAMGLSTQQAFSDLVTGIGRASPLILDNLGIVTGGTKTFDDYALAIGKSADDLTDAEKKQALLSKTIDSTIPLIEQMGGVQADNATSLEAMEAGYTNVKEMLGQIVMAALDASGAIGVVTKALIQLQGGLTATGSVLSFNDSLDQFVETGALSKDEAKALTRELNLLSGEARRGKITSAEYATGLAEITAKMQQLGTDAVTSKAALADMAGAGLANEIKSLKEAMGAGPAETPETGPSPDYAAYQASIAAEMSYKQALFAQDAEARQLKADAEAAAQQAELDARAAHDAQLESMAAQHASSMESIAQREALGKEAASFAYQVEMVSAQSKYQAQRAALLAQGKTEEANKLDQSYKQQRSMAEADYRIQELMQKRESLIQQRNELQKYMALLGLQGSAGKDSLQLQGLTSGGLYKIMAAGNADQIEALGGANSDMLKEQGKFSSHSIEMMNLYRQTIVNKGPASAFEDEAARIEKELADTQDAILQGYADKYAGAGYDLGSELGSGIGAGIAATPEPATQALADVADDVEKGIAAIGDAMQQLPGMMWTPAMEAGLDQAGMAMQASVASMYDYMFSTADNGKTISSMAKEMEDSWAPMLGLFKFLDQDLAKAAPDPRDAAQLTSDVQEWTWQLKVLSGNMFYWVSNIPAETAATIDDLEDVADDLTSLMAISGDIGAARPDLRSHAQLTSDVQEWTWQLKVLSGNLYYWLSNIPPELKESIKQAAIVGADVIKIMELAELPTGVVPAGPGWQKNIDSYMEQSKYMGARMMDWLGYLDEDTRQAVHLAGVTAMDVKDLFGLFDLGAADLTTTGNFLERAVDWAQAMSDATDEIVPIMNGTREKWGDQLRAAADTAGYVENWVDTILSIAKKTNEAYAEGTINVADMAFLARELQASSLAITTMGLDPGMQVGLPGGMPAAPETQMQPPTEIRLTLNLLVNGAPGQEYQERMVLAGITDIDLGELAVVG